MCTDRFCIAAACVCHTHRGIIITAARVFMAATPCEHSMTDSVGNLVYSRILKQKPTLIQGVLIILNKKASSCSSLERGPSTTTNRAPIIQA